MKEKDVQSLFTKWAKSPDCPLKGSFAAELKLVKGGASLPFSSFQPQQLPMLQQAKHGCVYKKLSDADPTLKPFDCLRICNADAFVIVLFFLPRTPKIAYAIDIDDFCNVRDTATRKSITKEQCRQLAKHIIHF